MAITLLACVVGLSLGGKDLLAASSAFLRGLLSRFAAEPGSLSAEKVAELSALCGGFLLLLVFPLGALASLISTASALLQGGALLPARLGPDFSRLSPSSGLQRLFKVRSLARGFFAAAKIIAVLWIAAAMSSQSFACLLACEFSRGGAKEAVHSASIAGLDQAARLGLRVSLTLAALGFLQYLFERWQHERDLRMTPAEAREELLRLEGNAELKSRQRKAQREITGRGSSEEGFTP